MMIQVTPDACTGCRLCRQVCAIEKNAETNPRRSRLKVVARFPAPGTYQPVVCDQCGDCAEACPVEAIVKDDAGDPVRRRRHSATRAGSASTRARPGS